MINFPTTSSVAVADVRPLLNRVVRIYKSAGADGQSAIRAQTDWVGWGIRDVMQWPPAVHPSAQAVRKDLLELVRRLTNAEFENRRGIAEQIEAAWESVGIPVKTMSGASGEGVVGPVVNGKVTCHINDGPGSFGNISYVNWTIDSAPVVASGVAIEVPVKDTPTLVWAAVYDLHGNNYAVSWTIPGKLDVPGTLVVAAGDASHPTEAGYRVNLFGDLVPTAVYGGDIRLLIATQSSGQIALGFVTSIGRDTLQVTIDGTTLEMVAQDQITFYANDTTVWDRIKNGIGDTLPITYIGGTEGIPARSAPRVHALEDVKGLTKTELVALLSGE